MPGRTALVSLATSARAALRARTCRGILGLGGILKAVLVVLRLLGLLRDEAVLSDRETVLGVYLPSR